MTNVAPASWPRRRPEPAARRGDETAGDRQAKAGARAGRRRAAHERLENGFQVLLRDPRPAVRDLEPDPVLDAPRPHVDGLPRPVPQRVVEEVGDRALELRGVRLDQWETGVEGHLHARRPFPERPDRGGHHLLQRTPVEGGAGGPVSSRERSSRSATKRPRRSVSARMTRSAPRFRRRRPPARRPRPRSRSTVSADRARPRGAASSSPRPSAATPQPRSPRTRAWPRASRPQAEPRATGPGVRRFRARPFQARGQLHDAQALALGLQPHQPALAVDGVRVELHLVRVPARAHRRGATPGQPWPRPRCGCRASRARDQRVAPPRRVAARPRRRAGARRPPAG